MTWRLRRRLTLPGQRRGASSADLWRQLEHTALERLRASEGVLTIDRADRGQRNLFLSLERLASVGTVTKVVDGGTFRTYRLPE